MFIYKKIRSKHSNSDSRFETSAKNCFRKIILPDMHISKIVCYGTVARGVF